MTTADPARPRRRSLRNRLLGALAAAVACTGGGEAFLRFRYGLGDPPILMSDPLTIYRYAPSRHYVRLGNRVAYNAYSMRSDEFPRDKSSPAERRVLVLGDSVINGGGGTDQPRLATSILQARLRRGDATPAFVGNASAGGWGPQNELGYVAEFGLFEADVVVIVVSSHDACEVASPAPRESRPFPPAHRFALAEAFDKLRERYLGGGGDAGATPLANGDPIPTRRAPAEPCLTAFAALLDRVIASGARPIVVFHFTRGELDQPGEAEGHARLRELCAARGLAPVPDDAAMRASLAAGRDPYRDDIHPNVVGQAVLAELIAPPVEAALAARTPPTTAR